MTTATTNTTNEQRTIKYNGQRFASFIPHTGNKVELRRNDLSVFIDGNTFKRRALGGLLVCTGKEISRCALV